MAQSEWRARLYRTGGGPMRVDAVHDPGETPGNVGICFSGGSTRAMCAAMGQLRGLCRLTANGRPLFGQARAVAAVSGGSWCLTPFTFLKDGIADVDYYGAWCAPEDLRIRPPRPPFAPQAQQAADVDALPRHSIGRVTAEVGFAVPPLGGEAIDLSTRQGVPAEDLWQTLMARHILQRYDLYRPGARAAPTTTFALDAAHRAALVADNPGLDPDAVHVCARGPARVRRPFLIVCSGLLVDEAADQPAAARQMQVGVHTTPVFTGVLGAPDALDANGRLVGGGGVSSFAFLSRPLAVDGDVVRVASPRHWSLSDAIGTSSVCYAEGVQNLYNELIEDPDALRARMKVPEGITPPGVPPPLVDVGAWAARMVPRYPCWPARDPRPAEHLQPNRLTDGGTLDNTGITFMLAYADIDHVIAFLNSMQPLAAVDAGVFDAAGVEQAGSRVFVNDHLPPLFGYQPWVEGRGYRLYAGEAQPTQPALRNNQVFEAAEFAPFLRALREASQAGGAWYTAPATVRVTLRVLPNAWHGVAGRGGPDDADPRPITLTFNHLSRVRRWRARLPGPLRAVLGDVDRPSSYGGFPHVNTMRTALGARTASLLAHQTAWCVADESNAALYRAAFEPR